MTPCPASRSKVKRISPSRVFLSKRMASIMTSSDGAPARIIVGSPARWSTVPWRRTTSADTRFSRWAMRTSTLIPIAMASPCVSVPAGALFPLVAVDNPRLDGRAPAHATAEHFQIAPQQGIDLLLGESQQVGVADHPVLDDFGHPPPPP